MFKDEYTKQFNAINPSPALNEETIALIQEAQAHADLAEKKTTNLRWVLPLYASGAAAVLALTIGLAFWFSRPELMSDIQGDGDLLLGANSSVTDNVSFGDSQTPDAENNADQPADDSGETNPSSTPPQNGAEQPEENNGASPDTPVTDGENPEKEGDEESSGDTQGDKEEQKAEQENKEEPKEEQEDEQEKNDAEQDPSEEQNKNESPEQNKGDEQEKNEGESESEKPESDKPAETVDPKAPIEINDKKTETYLSLRSYLDGIATKKTIGYKTNYLTEEALVLVPTWLPTTARFRQLYAYSNGGYTYSYLMKNEGVFYFLNVSVSATQPRTQRDLLLRTNGIETEEKLLKKTNKQWIYYFGAYDRATVTVTTIDGKAVSMDQAAPMLDTLGFARYTVQNTLVEMAYN